LSGIWKGAARVISIIKVTAQPFKLPGTPLVTSPSDTTPPSVPTGLAITGHTGASLTVSWTASTDDLTGVKQYIVKRDGQQIAVVQDPTVTYTDNGLAASSTHFYTVAARDFALNTSADSAQVTGTTDTPPADTTPPSTPTNFAATNTTNSTISLSWTASTDNVGVTGYTVYRRTSSLNSVLISCTVDPNDAGGATVVADYGPTDSLGSTSAAVQIAQAGSISILLTGLPENTTFFYRLRVQNATNITVTALQTFRTPALSRTQLVNFVPPQGYLKGNGSTSTNAAIATAAALIGPLFKGGHAAHMTEAPFQIIQTNPSAGVFNYTTWPASGNNRAWWGDKTATIRAIKTSIDLGRASGSGTDVTLLVFGCETWKNNKGTSTLPAPSHFNDHVNAAIDFCLSVAAQNGGAQYITHISTWQEPNSKGRVNLTGPPAGWDKTGLPNTTSAVAANYGTTPYHAEGAIAGTANILSCFYLAGRRANSFTGGCQPVTAAQSTLFTAAPAMPWNATQGWLFAQDPAVLAGLQAFKPIGGTGSPFYGGASALSAMGMTSNQIADATRELARDNLNAIRTATPAQQTVGAIEAVPVAGTPTDWDCTVWDPTAAYLRTQHVTVTGAGTHDGTTLGNAWSFNEMRLNYQPGDDIIVENGDYTHPTAGTPWFFSRPGSSSAPVRIRAANPLGARLFWNSTGVSDSIVQFTNAGTGNYLILEGFELDGGGEANIGVDIKEKNHHVAVRHCRIHHCRGSGVQIRWNDYIRIDDNDVWDNGLGNTSSHPSGISYDLGSVNYGSSGFSNDGYDGFHVYIVNNSVAGSIDDATTGTVTDGNGIIMDNGGTNTVFTAPPTLIANNVIYHNGNRGIHALMSNSTGVAGRGIYIINNTCYENGLDTDAITVTTGICSEFNLQGGVVNWANNVAIPWQGPGGFGSYAWEGTDNSFNPDTYIPNASGVGPMSDTNYDQYYPVAVTAFYNKLFDAFKNHANPIINTVKVGGPHYGFGGDNAVVSPTGGAQHHELPLGNGTWTSDPFNIDYFFFMYFVRWAHGFDFLTLDYSIVDNGDSPNANVPYIVAKRGDMGNLIRRVRYHLANYPNLSQAKRAADIHMIEMYFDVNLTRVDANYAEDVQAMLEALMLREVYMNGATKGYRWQTMGDVNTNLINTYAYFRNTNTTITTNSSAGLVTNTGPGTKYKSYDVAKLFSDNFPPGNQLVNVTSAQSDLVTMGSPTVGKVLVINTNTASSRTFSNGTSHTIAAKDVQVYTWDGVTQIT
jgi:hypothetical protein